MQKSIPNLRTIKIDITTLLSDEDKVSIDATVRDSAIIFNYFAKLGNEKQSTSYQSLHKYGYDIAKQLTPDLPTAILQQTAKVALASVKSWNSKVNYVNKYRQRKNNKAIKNGWKNYKLRPIVSKWEYQGNKNATSYPINQLSLSRRGTLTTFSSNHHRIRIIHDLPTWFTNKYKQAKLQAGSICINSGRYFLHLVYRIKVDLLSHGSCVIGVDRGINNLYATSKGEIYSSEHILTIKQKYQTHRKQLQQKGTRSAKRRLKKLSGREKRFMLNVNHCATKYLASDETVGTYVLEKLTGICNQDKGKDQNRLLSNWSFFQFEFFLIYKCLANGILAEYIDPRYTSQKCSICKKVHENSRNGEQYHCVYCGHTEHADINAAKNIRDNYLEQRAAFNRPIVAASNR